ncbi:MAG: hypothetical protein F4X34_06725 [Chloroflexi bacterium]|nr:hypothetical protein [Chloroflexota bacterium]
MFLRLIRFLDDALYPSARARIRRYYNLVIETVAAFVAFAALAAVVILLNLLIDFLIKDASPTTRNLVAPIADVLPIVFVVASAITSIFDIIKLVIASLRNSDNTGNGSSR